MTVVYLNPITVGGCPNILGDDNWWTWFARESGFDCRWGLPDHAPGSGEVIVHYSLKGKCPYRERSICLAWELYPQLLELSPNWAGQVDTVLAGARSCQWRTVSTEDSVRFYDAFGPIDILSIAVDTERFRPPLDEAEKMDIRRRLGLPVDRRIAFWLGWRSPSVWPSEMKGWDLMESWAAANPSWYVDVVDKDHPQPQTMVAERMRAADAWLNTSRLRPYYLTEWECMATNLPMIEAGGRDREFTVSGSPRDEVFQRGWSRSQALGVWRAYIQEKAA